MCKWILIFSVSCLCCRSKLYYELICDLNCDNWNIISAKLCVLQNTKVIKKCLPFFLLIRVCRRIESVCFHKNLFFYKYLFKIVVTVIATASVSTECYRSLFIFYRYSYGFSAYAVGYGAAFCLINYCC